MADRPRPSGNRFLAVPNPDIQFVSSGAAVLDCALGGGWPLGRIVNIVGDKSTGKTLLAIEACANFARQYSTGLIWYAETEAAFDEKYAASLGLPLDRIGFPKKLETVEDLHKNLVEKIDKAMTAKVPALYILDSLDALSDDAEMERKIGEGSYGTGKAKQMSEMLRRLTQGVYAANMLLMIVSQVRSNIGVTFGRATTRSGGRALDFYASQVLFLAHLKAEKRTINKVERVTGIRIRAKVDKNKIGLPLRECEFSIRFGFGIDDEGASKDWLKSVGVNEADIIDAALDIIVRRKWAEIETSFLPQRRKYQ